MNKSYFALQLVMVLISSASVQAGQPGGITVQGACTPDEKWVSTSARKIVPEWLKRIPAFNSTNLSDHFLPLNPASRKGTPPAFVAYLAGRAYYRAGLIHLAFTRFEQVLQAVDPLAAPLVPAAMECLAKLQTENTFLKLSPASIKALSLQAGTYPGSARKQLTVALIRNPAEVGQYGKAIGPFVDPNLQNLVRALLKVAGKSDAKAAVELAGTLDATRIRFGGSAYQSFLDMADLTLIRSYYSAGMFPEAIARAKQIAKTHPYKPEVIELMAWAHLQNQEMIAGNGQALTLRMKSMSNYFAPETTLIPSLVFVQNCQFEEAKMQLDYFRVKYRAESQYLGRMSKDRYVDLMNTLQGKKPLVPAKVIFEWLKSPEVTSLLEESNAIVDERDFFVKAKDFVAKESKGKAFGKAVLESVKRDLQQGEASLQTSELASIKRLRTILDHKTTQMKDRLDAAAQNAALMEVDILLELSKKIARASGNGEEEGAAEGKESRKPAEKPDWNWGKKVSADLEKDEVWADEVGNFRAGVKNQCRAGTKK